MAFKMIDNLEKLCGRLAGAASRHRVLITDALSEKWRSKLPEGQTIPDLFQLQTFLGEELHEIHQQVVANESRLKAELTGDRQTRKIRDRSAGDLRERLFAARKIFDAVFGPGGSDVVFQELNSQVRLDPVPLHRQGVLVHDNLLNPAFVLPPLRLDVGVDLTQIARGMEPSLGQLGGSLSDLHQSTQGSNASLEAKERSMLDLDKLAGLSARLLEALYAYSGHEGIASRTRQSSHVSGLDAGSPTLGPSTVSPADGSTGSSADGSTGSSADGSSGSLAEPPPGSSDGRPSGEVSAVGLPFDPALPNSSSPAGSVAAAPDLLI